ncbi:MAG: hypothetical protein ACYDCK_10320 [Thermoplasmatota archaeon]
MKAVSVPVVAEMREPVEAVQVEDVKNKISMVAELLGVIAVLFLTFILLYVAKNFMA